MIEYACSLTRFYGFSPLVKFHSLPPKKRKNNGYFLQCRTNGIYLYVRRGQSKATYCRAKCLLHGQEDPQFSGECTPFFFIYKVVHQLFHQPRHFIDTKSFANQSVDDTLCSQCCCLYLKKRRTTFHHEKNACRPKTIIETACHCMANTS
jgi:hypothetical protein